MTEDYKPTDNAIAERVNGILKQELIYRRKRFASHEEAYEVIERFITFYNDSRPHMSIDYQTPSVAHQQVGTQQRRIGRVIRNAVNKISTTSVNQFRMDVNKFRTTVNSFRKM